MPTLDEVPVERTLMQVLLRYPWTVREGLLFVEVSALEWQEIPYRHEEDCDHEVTGCPNCLENWFFDHNIRLSDRDEPGIVLDFDVMRERELSKTGQSEPLDATFIFE